MIDSCAVSNDILSRSTASRPSLGPSTFFQPRLPVGLLPRQTTTTSALLAMAMARLLLVVWLIATPALNLFFIPSKMLTLYGGVPLYQSCKTSSDRGPTTAIDLI